MDFIVIFLLPKALAAFLVWVFVDRFRTAQRKGRLRVNHYFDIGMAGYNFVAMWATGLLAVLVQSLFWLCIAGSFASLGWSVWCDVRNRWQLNKALRVVCSANQELLSISAELQLAKLLYALDLIDEDEADLILMKCNARIEANQARVASLGIPEKLERAEYPLQAETCQILREIEVSNAHH